MILRKGLLFDNSMRHDTRSRPWIWRLRLLLGALLTFNASTAWCASPPSNILLVIADDYGADSSSLYNSVARGASLPPTPHVVSLARRGVVFAQAYANPLCSPTRACLMTGRHGFRTGVGNVVGGAGSVSLPQAEVTLPEAIAAAPGSQYQLAHFGKWHLASGVNSPAVVGGWPHFAGSLPGAIASYTRWTKVVNGVQTAAVSTYATTDVVNDASEWIRAQGSRPWFAWVAFNAPHSPLHVPPQNLAPGYATNTGVSPARRQYEAMVEAMDTELGRLLSVVDLTSTHVIFMGDNGTPSNVLQPPLPQGRGKDTLYEGGTRIPLVIAGPAVTNPGTTNTALVHAVDLFGTILEMAGIDPGSIQPREGILDSQSLLPLLAGQAGADRMAYAEVFSPTPASDQGRLLRDDRFKLIVFGDGRREFYDLAVDPFELTNLLSGKLGVEEQRHYDRLAFRIARLSNLPPPSILEPGWAVSHFQLSANRSGSEVLSLWRCTDLVAGFWAPVPELQVNETVDRITWSDPLPPAEAAFYAVLAEQWIR